MDQEWGVDESSYMSFGKNYLLDRLKVKREILSDNPEFSRAKVRSPLCSELFEY